MAPKEERSVRHFCWALSGFIRKGGSLKMDDPEFSSAFDEILKRPVCLRRRSPVSFRQLILDRAAASS